MGGVSCCSHEKCVLSLLVAWGARTSLAGRQVAGAAALPGGRETSPPHSRDVLPANVTGVPLSSTRGCIELLPDESPLLRGDSCGFRVSMTHIERCLAQKVRVTGISKSGPGSWLVEPAYF